MDWVRGGDSTAPALGPPGTSPADGDRSNSAAGDPFFTGTQINGGGPEADLTCQPSIPDIALVPDEATYSTAHRGLITPPATLRGANTCDYGPDCNPDAPADDSENIIVVPGWKKR